MANLIQIKRAIVATAPSSLANGELAYSGNTTSDSLFIGNPNGGTVTRIGGEKFGHVQRSVPGTLTANAAIITNNGNFIDALRVGSATANVVINTGSVALSNSTAAIIITIPTAAQISDTNYYLNANGTYAFVNTSAAPGGAGATTQLMFNDAGVQNTNPGFTFNKTTLTISVGNSTVNTVISGSAIDTDATLTVLGATTLSNTLAVTGLITGASGATITGTANATVAINVGSNVNLSTSKVTVGNSTVNSIITATAIDTDGTLDVLGATALANTLAVTGVTTLSSTLGVTGATTVTGLTTLNGAVNTTTANASVAVNVGANVNLSTSNINVGNSTVNTAITATAIDTDGTLAVLGATTLASTLAVAGLVTGASGAAFTGSANATVSINVGANVNLSTSNINVGNSTVNTAITATAIDTDGTLAVLGATTLANTLGVTGAATLASTLAVGGAVTVTGATTLNGAVVIGDATADLVTVNGRINTHVVPSANVTNDLGDSGLRWRSIYAANVHSTTGYFGGSVQISGDLVVAGNVTTTNVSSMSVSDPLIYLGAGNNISDILDLGWVAHYNNGANSHAGVIRHAATDDFYVFKGYTPEPGDNVIDVAHASFALASVNAYLKSGALVSNSTNLSITANSTLAVAFTANTMSLSTPLPGTSGGTGLNSYVVQDILVANSTNGFRKLSVGGEGYVLQSNGTAVIYATLDGGTF